MTLTTVLFTKAWLFSSLLALSATGCRTAVPAGTVTAYPTETVSPDRAALLALVNDVRTKGCRCGSKRFPPAPPLRWNDKLETAAVRHAQDMESHDFFNHKGSDGSTIGKRATRAGYQWRAVAENISWGYPNQRTAIQGWFDSPGHCRNIMNPEYEEMGMARAGTYWVQALGKR